MPLRFVFPSAASANIVAISCSNCSAGRISQRNRATVSPVLRNRCFVPGSTTTVSPAGGLA